MIAGFEVGAVFKIINEASPALAKILKQVRELQVTIDKAKTSLSSIGASPGLTAAIAETGNLAKAWNDVSKNAAAAQRAMGSASVRSTMAAASAATGGGGNRFRPRSGMHITGPGAPIPGGGHIRSGSGGMAAAGLMGYGVYEAAEMEKYVFQLLYHSHQQNTPANALKLRRVLQDSMGETGFGLEPTAKAALDAIRMLQGTPGGGLDVLPELLSAAGKEAILKDNSPQESVKSLIGLAHMSKVYDPQGISKLARTFAFLSTANPSSLGSIERAAGYAVPLLQSGLDIDPTTTLLLGTALTRAGATNTKSGTWLREMALRAMPGTSLMSRMAFNKHEDALRALGLVDDKHKPTWFDSNGKPDLLKMLDIGGAGAARIPLTQRAAIERSLFGAQGGGGFALLADPAVREQIQSLMKEMNSPGFKNQYDQFFPNYNKGSTAQSARTAVQDFNILMMDIGEKALPSVNNALGNFKSILESITKIIPGGDGKSAAVVGGHAMLGAGGGALVGMGIGMAGGPIGMAGGALLGGVIGGAEGVAEAYMANNHGAGKREKPEDRYYQRLERLEKGNKQSAAPAIPNITMNLNVDGRSLGEAIMRAGAPEFPIQAPAFDGLAIPSAGDDNFTAK